MELLKSFDDIIELDTFNMVLRYADPALGSDQYAALLIFAINGESERRGKTRIAEGTLAEMESLRMAIKFARDSYFESKAVN